MEFKENLEAISKETLCDLLKQAKAASKNSYSPYSKFPVGAATLYKSGKIYVGCNVETASYGLSLCAERNAVSSAIAAGEKTPLMAIAVYCKKQAYCVPCGACLQWLSECKQMAHGKYDIQIVLENKKGEVETKSLSEFFPYDFKFD